MQLKKRLIGLLWLIPAIFLAWVLMSYQNVPYVPDITVESFYVFRTIMFVAFAIGLLYICSFIVVSTVIGVMVLVGADRKVVPFKGFLRRLLFRRLR